MEYDGGLQRSPSGKRDQASSLDASLSKTYPKQAAVYSTVGGSTGAIEPKTFRKHMWPFIRAIAELETNVVSTKNNCLL